MAPGPRVIVEQGRAKLDAANELNQQEDDDEDEDDAINASPVDMGSQSYYRSEKILGKLYRAIDEESFFANLQKDSDYQMNAHGSFIGRLWTLVKKEITHIRWKHHEDRAYEIKEM